MLKEHVHHHVERFEPLSKDVVLGVAYNSQLMVGTQDPVLQKFSNPDYLLSRAAVFALGLSRMAPQAESNFRVQSPESHRAFTLTTTQRIEDEFGGVYSQIGVKGTGFTRNSVGQVSEPTLGLFGERHARQDMDISNIFASRGGRTSRGIALLPLNGEKLIEWARKTRGNEDSWYGLEAALDAVRGNGDVPCLYVRLIGADRYSEMGTLRSDANVGNVPYTREQMARRGFGVISTEVKRRGEDAFQKRYGFIDSFMKGMRRAIDSGESTDIRNAMVYANIHFFNYNLGIFRHVREEYKDYFGGELGLNVHRGNQDIAGFWVDWENSHPDSGQYEKYNIHPGYFREFAQDELNRKRLQNFNDILQAAGETVAREWKEKESIAGSKLGMVQY